MKKYHFTLLFVSILLITKSQVHGYAYLNGSTNHSGIKVKLIANSPTAITDSTYTDQFGYYSKNISGGIYSINFSQVNYQPIYYNNNATAILTNTSQLNNVTLYYGTVVNVSGTVSGNWTNNNIYIVNSDLTIPINTTLTIDPATVIKVNGGYSITANGVLKANGNSNSKILFTTNNSNPNVGQWKGLVINNSQSVIKNCVLEYGSNSIWVEQASPIIEENEIRFFANSGIVLNNNSNSIIKNNSIHDFTVQYASGINIYNCNASVECNAIYNGAVGRGIIVSDGTPIKNNLIYNIQGGVGISCYYISNSRIENNVIHDCLTSIEAGETVGTGPTPLIINNTIFSNTTGVSSRNICHPSIIGNIIVNNLNGTYQDGSSNSSPTAIAYNCVWNNSQANYNNCYISGVGQIVNTNTNGTPVDSYFNISVDPLFVNNVAPILSSNSPCYGAGSTNYASYIGCNTSLMCASIVLDVKKIDSNSNIKSFPNPTQGLITITNLKKSDSQSINLFDINGKNQAYLIHAQNENEVTINIQNVMPGIYFLEISNAESQKTFLKIIKE